MEKSIYKYILRYSTPQQITLTILAIVSFPFLYVFYELPKEIINGAVEAKTRTFPVEFFGIEFDQFDYLFTLCGLFLLLVAINQGFKYVINVYRGVTGERMLRRLRFDLYGRVLRFPLPHFRKTSQGEVVTMITGEVEPLGGFIGDAFSLPVFQGGTLLVILGFLFIQDWAMALAAVALYPIQLYIIPKLQRKVNNFGRERVRLVRRLSEKIGETISGVPEIHAHDTAAFELAEFSHRLGLIYEVRLKIYVWKFIIKFINNSINHLGPFCFYAIGGYLVIEGQLEIGTLLAAIAAYKDLAAPWKELLNYYQRQADARIKFEQVIEQFEPPGMLVPEMQLEEPESIEPISGEIVASNVSLEDDTGTVLVDGTSFTFPADDHVAVVGGGGSGKEEIARLVARLVTATSGAITVNGARLADMPEAITGRRIAYVPPAAYMFSTSVRDNLFYGLKHRPLIAADYDDDATSKHARFVTEARAAGNSTDDVKADWIDYASAGVDDRAALTDRALEVLAMVEMEDDIYELGLRGVVDPAARPDVTSRLLEARKEFHARLAESGFAETVEGFDEAKYNDNATIGENLLFGTPVGDAFDPDRLAENEYVLQILEEADLADRLLEMGREVAATMVELFADLPPGHHFFEQFSFISSDDLPEFQAVLARVGREGIENVRPDERTMLLSLPFKLSSARHRLGIIDDEFRDRILTARRMFAESLPDELRGAVEFFDHDKYNSAAAVQDNILFGKLAYGQAQAAERVGALIGEVVDALDLRKAVMEIGLDYEVGIAGARLSSSQRQRLAIARAVLKRPDLLILNEATASLDQSTQGKLMERLHKEMEGRGLLWVLHRSNLASHFDRVLVMRNGKVVEQGAYGELDRDGSALRELIDTE